MRKRNIVPAIKRAIIVGAALLLCASARASDFSFNPPGPVSSLGTLQWGSTGSNGFNNNYYFTPLSQGESVCVYVYNNNPTNAHTFNISIAITANQQEKTPSDGTWQNASTSTSVIAQTSPGLPGGLGAYVSGVALVSINLSGSSVLGGSPDTANVTVIQTSGTCFQGNNFATASTNTASIPIIQAISDGLNQAYIANTTLSSAATNAVYVHVNNNNASRSVYLDRAVITSSATAEILVSSTTALGTTCTTQTPTNERLTLGVTALSRFENACATDPTILSSPFDVFQVAGGSIIIDLRGVILASGTTTGISFVEGAAASTGKTTVTLFYYEK